LFGIKLLATRGQDQDKKIETWEQNLKIQNLGAKFKNSKPGSKI